MIKQTRRVVWSEQSNSSRCLGLAATRHERTTAGLLLPSAASDDVSSRCRRRRRQLRGPAAAVGGGTCAVGGVRPLRLRWRRLCCFGVVLYPFYGFGVRRLRLRRSSSTASSFVVYGFVVRRLR